MKKIISTIMLAIALAASPVAFTGCKSSPQTLAYKTLASVGHSTDAAFKSYLDLVVAGKINAASLGKVSGAYNTFQTAFNVAVTAAQGNPNATAPDNLSTLSSAVVAAITEAKTP